MQLEEMLLTCPEQKSSNILLRSKSMCVLRIHNLFLAGDVGQGNSQQGGGLFPILLTSCCLGPTVLMLGPVVLGLLGHAVLARGNHTVSDVEPRTSLC